MIVFLIHSVFLDINRRIETLEMRVCRTILGIFYEDCITNDARCWEGMAMPQEPTIFPMPYYIPPRAKEEKIEMKKWFDNGTVWTGRSLTETWTLNKTYRGVLDCAVTLQPSTDMWQMIMVLTSVWNFTSMSEERGTEHKETWIHASFSTASVQNESKCVFAKVLIQLEVKALIKCKLI